MENSTDLQEKLFTEAEVKKYIMDLKKSLASLEESFGVVAEFLINQWGEGEFSEEYVAILTHQMLKERISYLNSIKNELFTNFRLEKGMITEQQFPTEKPDIFCPACHTWFPWDKALFNKGMIIE